MILYPISHNIKCYFSTHMMEFSYWVHCTDGALLGIQSGNSKGQVKFPGRPLSELNMNFIISNSSSISKLFPLCLTHDL